jgi:hypothetical protein
MVVKLRAKPAPVSPEGPAVPAPIIPPAEAKDTGKGKKEKKTVERDKEFSNSDFCIPENAMAKALDKFTSLPFMDFATVKRIMDAKRKIMAIRDNFNEIRLTLIKVAGESKDGGKTFSIQPTIEGKDKEGKPTVKDNPKFVEFRTEFNKLCDEKIKWTHPLVVVEEKIYEKTIEKSGEPLLVDDLILVEDIFKIK